MQAERLGGAGGGGVWGGRVWGWSGGGGGGGDLDLLDHVFGFLGLGSCLFFWGGGSVDFFGRGKEKQPLLVVG